MVFVSNSGEVDMSNQEYVELRVEDPTTDSTYPTQRRLARYRTFIEYLVAPLIPPGMQIFDYGCGYGGFLSVAQSLGYDAHGIDPCKARAEHAQSKWGLHVIPAFGRDIPDIVPGLMGRFDFIFSEQVFEHLETPREDVAVCFELLKPGGYLYLEVPNWNSRRLLGKERMCDTAHYNYFTPRTLAKLVRNGGFSNVRTQIIVSKFHVGMALKSPLGYGKWLIERSGKWLIRRSLSIGSCNVLVQKPLHYAL